MQQRKLALANIAGTTLMTLFSHAVSTIKQKNFSEPDLLSQFLEKPPLAINKIYAKPAGWLGHYLVGHGFAAIYDQILNMSKSKPSTKNGFAMGILSGLAGIGIWKATFKMHPNPPKIPAKQFFIQLLLAHVVFGLVTDGAMQLLKRLNDEEINNAPLAADDTYYPLEDERAIVSPS